MTVGLKPVDLSFLKDFSFGTGAGYYPDKKVCIMSAGALAVRIAEGTLTLTQALERDIDGDENRYTTDNIDCVHPELRDLCINLNDGGFQDDEDRKEWALKTLPRILGTADETRDDAIKKIRWQTRKEKVVEAAKERVQKFLDTLEPEHLHVAYRLMTEDQGTSFDLMHKELEAVLQFFGK